MKRGILVVSALGVLLLAALAAPQANAACSSAQEFSTGLFPSYFYTSVPAGASTAPGSSGAARTGAFWEPGFRATQGSGTYGHANWWISYDGGATTGWYLRGNLTDSTVAGCPGVPAPVGDGAGVNELLVLLQDTDGTKSYVSLSRVRYNTNGSAGRQFDMGPGSAEPWTAPALVAIPKPFVNTSGRSGPTVTLNVQLADVAPAFQGYQAGGMPFAAHSSITGYQLCSQERLNTAAAPTRLASDGWVCTDVGTTQVGGRTLDRLETCGSTSNRRYVATRLVIDGNQPTDLVSQAVAVECNPTLATPTEIEPRRPTDRPGTIGRTGPKAR